MVVASSVRSKIKFLKIPTSQAWLDQALADMDTILLDHAQCERKAAGTAIQMMSRYPSSLELVRELTAIAQEELSHYDQVNNWLEKRGVPLQPVSPPPYGAGLKKCVRRQEPDRMLDLLLVSALIEARSHERLGLLGEHCPDLQLAKFYRSLMASEARHYGSYWLLATTYFNSDLVSERLAELAEVESEILSTLYPEPRIHS
ncbi:tRNA-(ms[2]io[6]A)-hydroxylase [cf. Phormidesmis sp. LEGE 11477]|uniref:tRNA-(ms[2]io[6]A)-hydroxylase n=1 Tax=cf. Phormidesmis sp. LEGE 11477 TaxID=1828680 RepID=UPI00187EF34D|nr:tRNA-(ms[2]io[6]A)-hydroxylase [cf. Phormidesmis sp. LEGE 11477]MBE9063674.1 tRNA-(ms[2]io[6]A)-hydroxylase [cf. Phormidesmis sp. LEGE 11477]